MKKNKILIILLVICMLSAGLSGCGKTDNGKNQDNSSQQEQKKDQTGQEDRNSKDVQEDRKDQNTQNGSNDQKNGDGDTGGSTQGIDIADLAGLWDCEDTTLEDPNTYVGFYELRIGKGGRFSLFDEESGNPGISGEIEVLNNENLRLHCTGEAFNPPECWKGMKKNQRLGYELVIGDDKEMQLCYKNGGKKSTLVFDMDNTDEGDDD